MPVPWLRNCGVGSWWAECQTSLNTQKYHGSWRRDGIRGKRRKSWSSAPGTGEQLWWGHTPAENWDEGRDAAVLDPTPQGLSTSPSISDPSSHRLFGTNLARQLCLPPCVTVVLSLYTGFPWVQPNSQDNHIKNFYQEDTKLLANSTTVIYPFSRLIKTGSELFKRSPRDSVN